MESQVIRTKSGEVITEEKIAEWVAEAERGYDLSTMRNRIGRPSLSDEGQSPRIQYRVGQATYYRAWQRAHREGVPTVSALSRALLQAYADGKVKLPAAPPKPRAPKRKPSR
jgi:hypothetical protein